MFDLFFGNCGSSLENYKYIKHDTLMMVGDALRSRMIFSYIYRNTPSKLIKEDKEALDKIYCNNVCAPKLAVTGLSFLATVALVSKYRNRFNTSNVYHYLKYIIFPVYLNTNIYLLSDNLFASRFIKHEEVGRYALKYNFGVFDFHNSKRESSIKALKSYIANECTPCNVAN